MKCAFKYSAPIVADAVDANMKTRPLTSDDRALIHALQVENGWEHRRIAQT